MKREQGDDYGPVLVYVLQVKGSCQELCVVRVFPSVLVAAGAMASREQMLPFLILFSEQDFFVPLCGGFQTNL